MISVLLISLYKLLPAEVAEGQVPYWSKVFLHSKGGHYALPSKG